MRKQIMTFILLAGLLVSAPATAHAESLSSEQNVSFTSDNKLSADYGSADMNNAVYNLQPGDDITITVNLKNDNPASSNWYMTNEVLQSLEETTGSSASGGAYEYELTYTDPTGEVEVLFTSDTVGGENNGSRVGLKAATSGLEDYLYLDTLSPGQRGVITLRVALDGETEGNSYQNTLAKLQMNFAVDPVTVNNQTITRLVDEEGNPIKVDDSTTSSVRTRIVRTDDENNLLPYIVTAGASGILLLLFAVISLKERRKRKDKGKAAVLVLAVCLALGQPWTAQASESGADDYTYTLRLYAGVQGTLDASVIQRITDAGAQVSIEDGEVCVVSGLHYGEQVIFDVQRGVALHDGSKYYRKGFRVSGEDNSSGRLATPSIEVKGDQDYVVSYGIQGETVAYTIMYVDAEGNELYPSATYYGNVGDKPVVAYQYIEGWQPQAYNLGKTLVADASQNVFTFIYSPIPTVTNTNTVVVPGQTPAVQPPAAAPPAQGGVTVVEGEEEPGEEPVAPVEPVGEDVGDENPPLAEPEPYEDLDNEDTPLGNFDGESETTGGSSILDDIATPLAFFPGPVRVGALAVLIALAGGLVWVLVARRKRKKEDEQ